MKKLLSVICIMALLVSASNFAVYATEAIPSELASETESVESVETNETETQSTVEWETVIDSENRLFPAVIPNIPIEVSPEELEQHQAELEAERIERQKNYIRVPALHWSEEVKHVEDHTPYMNEKLMTSIATVLEDCSTRMSSEVENCNFNFSIDSNGMIISKNELVLNEDEIGKIATIWYEAVVNNKKGAYWHDLYLTGTKYIEEDDVWLCFFNGKSTKEQRKGTMEVILRGNGEFILIGY